MSDDVATAQSVQDRLLVEGAKARVHWRLVHEGGETQESPRWRVYLDEFVPLGGIHHGITVALLNEVATPLRGNPGLLAQFGLSFGPNGPVFPLADEDVRFVFANAAPRNGGRRPSPSAALKAMAGKAPHYGF